MNIIPLHINNPSSQQTFTKKNEIERYTIVTKSVHKVNRPFLRSFRVWEGSKNNSKAPLTITMSHYLIELKLQKKNAQDLPLSTGYPNPWDCPTSHHHHIPEAQAPPTTQPDDCFVQARVELANLPNFALEFPRLRKGGAKFHHNQLSHYTGGLIGMLMVYYNPHING